MSARSAIVESGLAAKMPFQPPTQEQTMAALDPGTVALFVSLGAQVLNFAGQLFGGKTGETLSELAGQINGLGYKIQDIANQTQKLFTGIEETINSIDKQSLAAAWPVHDQVMAYRKAYPPSPPPATPTI